MKKSQEEMHSLVKQFESEKVSISKFSIRENVSYDKMAYWIRKSKKKEQSNSNTLFKEKRKFIPLNLPPVAESEMLEIIYPNGVCLKCSSSISNDKLQSIIKLF
jgi:hypothetical protein